MRNYAFYKRAFLNPVFTPETSYILAHVEDSRDGTEKAGSHMIVIADCRRVVELEFYLGNKRRRRISLAKINMLIKVLTAFRDALVKEIALIEKVK